ncbi:TetR/AcrR family transcriptional regulator [Solimicrobium silvestre]|uniref:Transcriptional regulator n=1 Tax=Solimicrobium silvestre TaxID=2099400 RepID=A0A2S9GXJ6_9BURK|nr:TetR/AcrR family transcriptional regulator [Solimicrobium silvestre]PRC92442.1 Transcriptional regulator [Solimicrobium silvestre]
MSICLKPRWARRKDARPQELLSAALEIFVERGYAATRLEEVARKAGVSKGTLYLYFENKEELFKAVVRDTIVPNIAQAEQLISEFQGSTKELFIELITHWCEQISAPNLAGICKLMFAEASNFPELAEFYYAEVINRNELMIIQLLERGMQSGEFRQLDLSVMPKIVTAPIVMLMLWSNTFSCCEPHAIVRDDYVRSYIEVILAGLLKN